MPPCPFPRVSFHGAGRRNCGRAVSELAPHAWRLLRCPIAGACRSRMIVVVVEPWDGDDVSEQETTKKTCACCLLIFIETLRSSNRRRLTSPLTCCVHVYIQQCEIVRLDVLDVYPIPSNYATRDRSFDPGVCTATSPAYNVASSHCVTQMLFQMASGRHRPGLLRSGSLVPVPARPARGSVVSSRPMVSPSRSRRAGVS